MTQFIKDPAPDVAVPTNIPLSKSRAVALLARQFRNPGIQNLTTAEDRAKGHERWRVYCLGDYGVRLGIVDVSGPAAALPKAAVVAAYRRMHIEVTFERKGADVLTRFTPIPLKTPEQKPEPAQPSERSDSVDGGEPPSQS